MITVLIAFRRNLKCFFDSKEKLLYQIVFYHFINKNNNVKKSQIKNIQSDDLEK